MKRLSLVIALTGLCLAGVFGSLASRSIEIRFDAKVERKTSFQVYYSTERGGAFSESNSVSKDVSKTPDFQRVSMTIPAKKIRRFRLDFGNRPGKVSIKNLVLDGATRFELTDFSNCSFKRVDFKESSRNLLSIVSTQRDPYLAYDSELDLDARWHFDWNRNWSLLVICGVCFFLLFYQLISYLAQFKLFENHSRIDIVFVVCFFVLLFLPMLKIDHADKSVQENRMLAKYKSFFTSNGINNEYGKNFESWFNDRFWGRSVVINLEATIRQWISELCGNDLDATISEPCGNDFVMVGKDNWLFYKEEDSVENYQNAHFYSNRQLNRIANYLTEIHNWCVMHKKKFVFMIAPDKHRVYGEFYPSYIKKLCPDDENRTYQLISYLQQNTPVQVVYPLDVFCVHKEEALLYWKNDTHWNEYGAYLGYKELMGTLNVEPLFLRGFKKVKYKGGDLLKMYPQAKKDVDADYLVPVFEDRAKWKPSKMFIDRKDKISTNKTKKKTLFLFHDSFSVNVMPYLGNSFAHVHTRWRYNFKLKDLKEMLLADYIVLEIVERRLPNLAYLIFPKE